MRSWRPVASGQRPGLRQRANYVERAHVWSDGRSTRGASGTSRPSRVRLNGDGPVKVIGRGQAGILGAYAALFEPSIKEVIVVDPPASHAKGPIFLNVLRVLDIPEALGLLAPRRLTLVNASHSAFDRTQEIYKRAGAEGSLQRR